jgi:hypothetical protein
MAGQFRYRYVLPGIRKSSVARLIESDSVAQYTSRGFQIWALQRVT